ncbi:methyl-accepting chemotaxis protein [Roseobacteraceae bacterium NS-SX3]
MKTSVKTAVLSIVVLAGAVMFGQLALSAYMDAIRTQLRGDVLQIEELDVTLSQLEIEFLMARRYEKDLLLRRDEKYVGLHAETMTRLAEEMAHARELTEGLGGLDGAAAEYDALKSAVARYTETFTALTASTMRLGFDENSGLQGELRQAVHNVETRLKEIGRPEMQVKMLMMRRHEKDFIMRKATKYLDRLNARIEEFLAFPADWYANAAQQKEIAALLGSYQTSFAAFVDETMAEAALRNDLSASYAEAEPVFTAIHKRAKERLKEVIAEVETTEAQAQRTALAAGIGGMALFGLIAVALALGISRPLGRLNAVLKQMMQGDFSQDLPKSRISEIAAITGAVAEFRNDQVQKDRLTRDISDVINACAQGDFSKRIDTAGSGGSFAELGRGVNQIGEAAEHGLGDVMASLSALAQGDLTHRMPEGHQGVFKDMSEAIGTLTGNLGSMVAQLTSSSEMLKNTSNEIGSAVDDASRRGESSAASLEETAGALQVLNDTVRSTAASAEEARQLVGTAQTRAHAASDLADRSVAAIKRVEDSSRAIAKITDLIEDVAFQTNLLALNAGVEAARAGEAGRGFAVVASEVRALAQRSAGAAQEINDLIKNSGREVSEGVTLVSDTGSALSEIQSMVEQVVGKVKEIASAAEDQASGLSEINGAITELDRDAQKSAAMLEETSAAGQMLRNEAANLVDAIGAFRVEAADEWQTQGADDPFADYAKSA